MTRKQEYEQAKVVNAVEAIIDDLTDRAGLADAWDDTDPDTRADIRAEWARRITRAMGFGA